MKTRKLDDSFSVKGKTVLLIDDSKVARAMCATLLEEDGYIVEQAEGAEEGMKLARKLPFDLILLDIVMPSIDGIAACRLMKEDGQLHDVPIIMISAAEESENLEKAFEAGAVDYITKPVRKFELLARLKSTIMLTERGVQLLKKNQELEKAFDEIKVLRGFIPVCAWCKKIRDMKGSWRQMESYIQEHSLAKFSHGICEDCMAKQRPKSA